MQKLNKAIGMAAGIALAAVMFHAPAQGRDFSKVQIKTVKLTDSIHVLFGAGGNIGVSVGDDGVFLIDDQYAPLSAKILAAVRKLSDKPIRFILNTHWHRDHTGGNENIGKAGAAIVAHENVRRRLSSPQSIPIFNLKTKPAPAGALPQVTFADGISLHFNGDHARIVHLPAAHTDGDSFVHFTGANVIHTGDLFFNGIYPFIDGWNGGSITGVIKAVDTILGIANATTKIIPGHGPMATRQDLVQYRDMLKTVHGRVARAMAAGRSAEDLVKSGAFQDIEKSWGGGFLNTQKFITVVYAGLKSR
ncbi:MAG: MBL fold metallo-hydrolase [Alphaproteobacteria bacterium]|nr:MBL fold metallo-hydrolase [Alphaproteobacteria bacterium]